jgi:hypothetical protein
MNRETWDSASDRITFLVGAAVGLTIGMLLAAMSVRESETNFTLAFCLVVGSAFALFLLSALARFWLVGRIDTNKEIDLPAWAHLPSLLIFSVSFGLFCILIVLAAPAIAGVLFGWSLAQILPAIFWNVLLFAPLRMTLGILLNVALIVEARKVRGSI